MRSSWKTLFGLFLGLLVAALLAGAPILSASAQPTGPAAGGGEPPAQGSAGGRVESDTGEDPADLSPNAIHSLKLESLLGREVRTRDEQMGRIIDILADRDGRVRAAVVELGGFLGIGTRRIAVDWLALRFDSRQKLPVVVLDLSREQLRLAPEYKPSDPVFVRRAE